MTPAAGEIGTSTRVTSSIGNMTSMMGLQKSEEDGSLCEYSYQPDNGLYVLMSEDK